MNEINTIVYNRFVNEARTTQKIDIDFYTYKKNLPCVKGNGDLGNRTKVDQGGERVNRFWTLTLHFSLTKSK